MLDLVEIDPDKLFLRGGLWPFLGCPLSVSLDHEIRVDGMVLLLIC
jgi:hypothetical protein